MKNAVLWDMNSLKADIKVSGGDTVRFLRESAIPQGLITTLTALEVQREFRGANINFSMFNGVLDGDTFKRHYCPPKPAKAAFELAISQTLRTSYSLEQGGIHYIVMVEDTLEHISAAHKLGMTTVQMITDNQPVSLHAHYVVPAGQSPKAAIKQALVFGRQRP